MFKKEIFIVYSFIADSIEERMFGHSNFETFRLEDLSGKCDLCEEFKTLEEDERRLKWEMVASVFFTLIFAAGMAALVREHWIVRYLVVIWVTKMSWTMEHW